MVQGCYIAALVLAPIVSAILFTALHGMQTRSSDDNSVRLSVRPSVKRVNCDKTEERSVQIFIANERSFSLVFREEEWLDLEGATPST